MPGFMMGGGVCSLCGRGGCVPSFHSFEEQEVAGKRDDSAPEPEDGCAEMGCYSKADVRGYCSYHYDIISNTAGT